MSTALAVTTPGRAQLTLTRIVEMWRRDARGAQYVEALKTFLAGLVSPNTRAQYSTSINEFFEWYESEIGRIPIPADIPREKAIRYAKWLGTRTVGLAEHRLAKDPERKLDLEIYRIVKGEPGVRIDKIRARLLTHPEFSTIAPYRPNTAAVQLKPAERVLKIEQEDPEGLDRHLGCLVGRHLLARTPTLADIRSGRVTVPGVEVASRAQLDVRVPEMAFSYRVGKHTEEVGPGRASTVKVRLGALKSFWSFLIRTGENVPGMTEPLLKYNIWDTVTAQATREAKSQQAANRALKTPDLELFNAILGTTYQLSDDGKTAIPSRDLIDVRDRAILFFMFYLACRAEELAELRRSDVTWEAEPLVSMLGKGNKRRLLRIPDPAYQALLDLTGKLEEMAMTQSPSVLERALLSPEAPLFPPTSRWGCNSPYRRATEYGEVAPTLSRVALDKMLHRRAALAGFAPGSPAYGKAHAHGFRALAAKIAGDSGTPVPIIQSVLGHSSLSTTTTYTEVHDPRKRQLFGWTPPQIHVGPALTPPATPRPIAPTHSAPRSTPSDAGTMPAVAARPPSATCPPPLTVKRVLDAVGIPVPDESPPIVPKPAVPLAKAPESPAEIPPPLLPKVAQDERLVAVGAESLLDPEQKRTETELDHIYESSWGEPGKGTPLRHGTRKPGDEAYDTLLRTTVGRRSGFPWWTGPTGRLKPQMPVIAPNQVMGEETPYGAIRQRLAEIWTAWMTTEQDDRGPTAAFALLAWIRDALEVTYDVETEVRRREGHWVPFLAPIGQTIDASGERRVFREHRDDRLAEWFYTMAWQHRISRGRTATGGRPTRVVDTVLDVPPWYALADPLAELTDAERTDLFDWLRVLTGRPPIDTTPRFNGVSRKAIGELLGLMCTYDATRSELRRAQQAGEKSAVRDLKQSLEDDRTAVNVVVQRLTRGRTFDMKEAVDARVAQTRQLRESEAIRKARQPDDEDDSSADRQKRESNRKFYLSMIGDLFGEAAKTDDILALFAYCNQEDAPLSGGQYPQLFHVQGKTIVHSLEYARQFARETNGAHSECVARRMARELWELRKAHLAAQADGKPSPRLIQRPDELVEWLGSMAFFKIPCPRALEAELRDRIADTSAVPVYEEWQRWRDIIEQTFREERKALREARQKDAERREAILEEFTQPAEEHRGAALREVEGKPMEPNARAREYRYTPNMKRFIPSPVLLLFCAYAR